jgi:general secretion pathway protein F
MMDTFSYEAVNLAGEIMKGEMEAASSEAVIEHLHRLGYLPLAADRKANHRFWQLTHLTLPRVERPQQLSLNDITFLTQELSVMLRAGLPIERALSVLASLAEQPRLVKWLTDLLARMREGASLADALAAQKTELPKGYIGMVRAGETGGARALETTLERITEHLKQMQKVRDGVFSAMLYPMIVLGVAALSIILILLFVLPQFEPLFQSAPPNALPLSTKIVIAVAHGVRNYGLFVLIAAIALGFALWPLLRRESFRLRRDKFLLRLPKIGPVVVKAEMARFCNMLGVLLTNGVPPVAALSTAAESFGNLIFASAAQRVVAHVREGEGLSKPMQDEPVFPALSLQMIRIGEETGRLDSMLLKTAEIYDRDVQRSTERLMTLLTPLTTIILGLVIAAIIAAVLSAILSINDLAT